MKLKIRGYVQTDPGEWECVLECRKCLVYIVWWVSSDEHSLFSQIFPVSIAITQSVLACNCDSIIYLKIEFEVSHIHINDQLLNEVFNQIMLGMWNWIIYIYY